MRPPGAQFLGVYFALGAYKPRMLRLTWQQADGWSAALGHVFAQAAAFTVCAP